MPSLRSSCIHYVLLFCVVSLRLLLWALLGMMCKSWLDDLFNYWNKLHASATEESDTSYIVT